MLNFSRLQIFFVLFIAIGTVLLAAPNALSPSTIAMLPKALQHKLALGLDLQGGVHLLVEVDGDSVKKTRLENLRNDVVRILRENKLRHQGVQLSGETVQFRLAEGQDSELALRELRKLPQMLSAGLAAGQYDLSVNRAENGLFTVGMTEAGFRDVMTRTVEQSIEVIRRRVDELGTTEPLIQRQGTNRVLVQVPGEKDPQRIKGLLEQTAKLEFRLVDLTMTPQDVLAGRSPADAEILYEEQRAADGKVIGQIPYLIQRRVIVSGDELETASAQFAQQQGEWVVSFKFNGAGGRKFAQTTQDNVGKPFAIILDKKVISAPVIREAILGGQGQISGRFTAESASNLALLLRAGALPAPLTVVEERTVGASLGQDSIASGMKAAWVGSALVIGFMLISYALFGAFAVVAVIINVGMILGVLSFIGATLTLPGIAGIVLTVGMAVDTNVIIYERIREEIRNGRSAIASLQTGFQASFMTIVDAHVTQLIATVILFEMGTGPVKGFAVTLGIGILTTLFTTLTLTRLIVATWFRWVRPAHIPL